MKSCTKKGPDICLPKVYTRKKPYIDVQEIFFNLNTFLSITYYNKVCNIILTYEVLLYILQIIHKSNLFKI